ncbi:MAG: PEP-CTERM sorting domain-containing protein [Rhodospirillaceae bacterium]|nr:PEP-CTERM sorting domain-containing protein [Rhodospirillaceae bacterium]
MEAFASTAITPVITTAFSERVAGRFWQAAWLHWESMAASTGRRRRMMWIRLSASTAPPISACRGITRTVTTLSPSRSSILLVGRFPRAHSPRMKSAAGRFMSGRKIPPEPGTMALFAVMLAGLGVTRRRNRP